MLEDTSLTVLSFCIRYYVCHDYFTSVPLYVVYGIVAGFCCAYLIFISENLSTYVSGVSTSQWLVLFLPLLYLLCLLRKLEKLAVFRCAQTQLKSQAASYSYWPAYVSRVTGFIRNRSVSTVIIPPHEYKKKS